MSDVNRYATERIEALWDRVESLEHTIERAGAFLEDGEGTAKALDILRFGLMDSFKSTLLCCRGTTDEHLDYWMPEIEKHEADEPPAPRRAAGEGRP